MSVTKLYVGIKGLYPLRNGDLWGPGDWHVTATIDGKQVGDPGTEFEAYEQKWITLDDTWSTVVDVSGKGAGDTVEVIIKAVDSDVFSDDDLICKGCTQVP